MLPPSRYPSSDTSHTEPDAAVRQTDTDAALARLSAVQKGYLSDPFIRHLVPRAHLQPARPPLINVGTYVRSEGIDALVGRFLALAEQERVPCQITSARMEWLKAYFELDFPEVTMKKAMAIRKSRELSVVLGKPEDLSLANGGAALHAPTYHLLPADIRRPPAEALAPLIPLLSPAHPTLLLFECVLVYMTPAASSALTQWFVDYFAAAHEGCGVLGGIVYEMFGLDDPFGKVMRANLQARNVSLPGVDPYPTQESLPERFLSHGFEFAKALTLRDIRRSYIDEAQQERISQLELLDEIEELELVLAHYAMTWGVKLPANAGALKVSWAQQWDISASQVFPQAF
ncbi:leucine carboxyl methyltransferase [Wolfiporia cocos MD-104 SS10]|uniref:Leucine carboxyl methyltransferase 1 n=1 Tax=Wolfiporia cocos (strain MD-104) TaxID=742152 RepID=A0A2H3JD00_WOLCO|nr:leucine carboxyl methyltransferase [Wolfiporia cocos MD-104 SS10]